MPLGAPLSEPPGHSARQGAVTTEHSPTLDGPDCKKRKRPEGDATSFCHDHDHDCIYKVELEDKAQTLRIKNSDYLVLERMLIDKDAKISTLTHDSTCYKGAYSTVCKKYVEVKQELDTLHDATDDRKEEMLQLKMGVNNLGSSEAQLKKIVKKLETNERDLEAENHALMIRNDHLEAKVLQLAARCQQLEEANRLLRTQNKRPHPPPQPAPAPRSAPAPLVADEPLLIAATDPRIREHPNYPHEEAPRTNRRYKHYQIGKSKVKYRRGQGKIRPGDYGPNGNWDLGLYKEHFETERGCRP